MSWERESLQGEEEEVEGRDDLEEKVGEKLDQE